MKISLSRQGWNNVLIFASMFMIILFNQTHKMLMDNTPELSAQVLVTDGAIIQVIDYSGIKLERIGSNWRIVTSIPEPDIGSVLSYVNYWQQQPLQPLTTSPVLLDSAVSLPVVVWVAGQPQGWVYEFFIDKHSDSYYVYAKEQQLWFALTIQDVLQLVPNQLIQQI